MKTKSKLNSVMETGDHFKNGAGTKSQMSSRNYLKIACFGLFAASIIIFSGCKKDNNEVGGNDGINKLEILVENGKDYSGMIDKVKLETMGGEAFATVDYNDGKFTLQLPSTVAAGNLYGISLDWDFSSTVDVSNPNAQGTELEIAGYKGDKRVCRFYYQKEDEAKGTYSSGYPVYVNSALTINGAQTETYGKDITCIYEDIYTFSINAKRGWNMWYSIKTDETILTTAGTKEVYKREITTTDPGGLKWNVEFDYYDGVTAGNELKITAQVENGNAYNNIKRIRANGYRYTLAVGNYINGGFSLTLPNTVYPEWTIEDYFSNYECITGLNISNKNAKVEFLYDHIRGYSSSKGEWQDYVGDFTYGKIVSNSVTVSATIATYIFADMDVNVTGSGHYYGDIVDCSMNLEAGWNTIYLTATSSANYFFSTTPVSGLKWYFGDDLSDDISLLSVKSLKNRSLNSLGFKNRGTKSRIFNK